jgi:DNA-directed RNA polymerase subunit M/transcription elongation factor TFIIS
MERIQSNTNSLNLTLPLEVYDNDEYSKERRQVILMLCSILDSYVEFKVLDRERQLDIVVAIEKSCFDKVKEKSNEDAIYRDWSNEKYVYLYSLICGRVGSNLDADTGNEYLINAIINDSIDIEKIGFMSSDELNPKIRKKINEDIEVRKNIKIKQKTTSLYTCRNCKSKKATCRAVQMKSLDEGKNLVLNCTVCSYRWIIST